MKKTQKLPKRVIVNLISDPFSPHQYLILVKMDIYCDTEISEILFRDHKVSIYVRTTPPPA